MHIDPTVTLGNVLTILAMLSGGIIFLISIGFKMGEIISAVRHIGRRLDEIEDRLDFLEEQNTLPVHQRHIPPRSLQQ